MQYIKRYMSLLLFSYTEFKEGDEPLTSLLQWQLGSMCCIYNFILNLSLENNSYRWEKVKYINGILAPTSIYEYIPMGKNLCISRRPQTIIEIIKVLTYNQSWHYDQPCIRMGLDNTYI